MFAKQLRNWRRRAMMDSYGHALSYGKLLAAGTLAARRLKREHAGEQMIGVMLPASSAAGLTNVSLTLAGFVPVNLNFTAGRDAFESAIQQCGLHSIYTSRQFLAKAKVEQRAEMRFVEDLFAFGNASKVLAVLAARLLPARRLYSSRAKADDLAAVLFSSGSTGTPKGVMLSHRNVIANVDSVSQIFQMDHKQTIAGVLPLFHSFGFTFTLWFPMLRGASAAYHPSRLTRKASVS